MRYATLGQIPGKRHVQVRRNGDGSPLLVEEVMGYEGFSGNESILLHLQSPCRLDAGGRLPPIEREEWVPDAHVHRLADAQPGGAGRRPGLRPQPADVERRHRGVGVQAHRAARGLLPQRRGRRGDLRPPRQRRAAHGVRPRALPRARLRRDPARDHAHASSCPRARSSSGSASTPPARSRRPTATATATASCSSTRRSRSATSTPPAELETYDEARRVPGDRPGARRLPGVRARPPPVRRGGLGRLRLARTRSTPTTSSRAPGASTCRRPPTRPSRGRTS